ncbi:acetylxylan esterase [Mucilaginibacter sp. PPCGB 2223]|uniref:alpha/beta hydrolase family protein n=1 Tax=Mucilaginibacter sp. PPCGB 2223 TaxID=1886027 RepID=UPI00082551EB|nr:CocE/NonD family hydrolase [Mucilaginibacter sp. PPCGB 2223]OCX53055.1 acetylxylan esterase [Mucilaginibacter sp. PPCGB 2223]
MKKISVIIFLMVAACKSMAQVSVDDSLKKPLKQVLTEVQARFHVQIKFDENLVKGQVVSFADWRVRPGNIDKTLNNILTPLDISYTLKAGVYSLRKFDYPRWSVEDGKEELTYLSSLYNDQAGWEKRKTELRACAYSALQLSPLPAKPNSKPIFTPLRLMDGYTIQNVAIETLPGYYVCGSIYRPAKSNGKMPVILSPNGHFEHGRYNKDQQKLCATFARMGAMAMSYDLFAWGESLLQFKDADHNRSIAMSIETLNGIRLLDFLLAQKDADPERVGITGASGGGSQTMLLASLDDRFKVSAPVVMLSSAFYGGSHSESGMPVHLCVGGTNNVELAAMVAPKPQLIVSDGKDWTANVPEIEFPFLQRTYGFYGKKDLVTNVHLPTEGHDYGINKRKAVYAFMAKYLKLDIKAVQGADGEVDETKSAIEPEKALYVFGDKGERLPANAVHGLDEIQKVFNKSTGH